jgi:hypothetical protein
MICLVQALCAGVSRFVVVVRRVPGLALAAWWCCWRTCYATHQASSESADERKLPTRISMQLPAYRQCRRHSSIQSYVVPVGALPAESGALAVRPCECGNGTQIVGLGRLRLSEAESIGPGLVELARRASGGDKGSARNRAGPCPPALRRAQAAAAGACSSRLGTTSRSGTAGRAARRRAPQQRRARRWSAMTAAGPRHRRRMRFMVACSWSRDRGRLAMVPDVLLTPGGVDLDRGGLEQRVGQAVHCFIGSSWRAGAAVGWVLCHRHCVAVPPELRPGASAS